MVVFFVFVFVFYMPIMSTFKNKRSLNEVDTNTFKKKRDETHLSSCRDVSCTGCAEGEVELVFTKLDGGESGTNEPTAAQFYQFALEESGRNVEMTPVARKLFERAIASFREEERVYQQSMDNHDNSYTEETVSEDRLNHQLLYASCQLTFAQQLSLVDKVHETISKLKVLTKYNNTSVWLHLGRAQLIAIVSSDSNAFECMYLTNKYCIYYREWSWNDWREHMQLTRMKVRMKTKIVIWLTLNRL
jgi:hypothetical protein